LVTAHALVRREDDVCIWVRSAALAGDLTAEHLLPRARARRGHALAENLAIALSRV
jgi:hypothetical protein